MLAFPFLLGAIDLFRVCTRAIPFGVSAKLEYIDDEHIRCDKFGAGQ